MSSPSEEAFGLEGDVLDEIFSEWEDSATNKVINKETKSSPAPSDAKQKEKDASSSASTSFEYTVNKAESCSDICFSPLEKFRPGYLWVTDLTRQIWCEQQLYYTFTVPSIAGENPVMTAGTDLHLARELAAHDIVKVEVQSSEDIWAIKMLNLHSALITFLTGGKIAREVPVFGNPFKENLLVVGIIDELQFDPSLYTIELNELKTRQSSSFPSKAQKKQHNFQVMLYKTLFDDLVKGKVSKEFMASSLQIDLRKELGQAIKEHAEKQFVVIKNLNDLMDTIFHKIQTLTCINRIFIEYVHQESKQTIGHVEIEYDVSEISGLYKQCVQFWRGNRSSVGVEIEEAWKCQKCNFQSVCEWREKKAAECEFKNKQNKKIK
ncbi:exonuclease V-like isoform X2 [Ostrea edulis]|uniref:exonuclease V-like isoform X2 n=1 Tax=Ostrea edulis TaxID=37623 RepID=UPI0024AF5708|nr:exonuclease V-like isoform X2 [Ostrea edulis]